MSRATPDAFDPLPGPTSQDTAAYLRRLTGNTGFAGFVMDPSGDAAPVLPPSKRIMRRIVSARGPGDTIHVIWTTPSPDSSESGQERFLWYAASRSGQWTTPKLLLEAERLDWTGARPSLTVRGSSIYIFTAYSDRRAAGIAYVRRIAGQWHSTEARMFGLPSEVTAQSLGGDSLALAYVGIGDRDVRVPNGSHIYVMRMSAADTTLPTAHRVQWSGLDNSHWPRLYRMPPMGSAVRPLLLLSGRWPRGGGRADVVLTLRSDDGGATWSPAGVLPLPFPATWMAQTQDAMGDIHIVVGSRHGLGGRSPHPIVATFHGYAWDGAVDLAFAQVVGQPTLSSIDLDSVLLVWGEGRPPDRRDTAGVLAPISRYAWWTRACRFRVP